MGTVHWKLHSAKWQCNLVYFGSLRKKVIDRSFYPPFLYFQTIVSRVLRGSAASNFFIFAKRLTTSYKPTPHCDSVKNLNGKSGILDDDELEKV